MAAITFQRTGNTPALQLVLSLQDGDSVALDPSTAYDSYEATVQVQGERTAIATAAGTATASTVTFTFTSEDTASVVTKSLRNNLTLKVAADTSAGAVGFAEVYPIIWDDDGEADAGATVQSQTATLTIEASTVTSTVFSGPAGDDGADGADGIGAYAVIVEEADDLAAYLSGDEYVLPANKLVIIAGAVNLGDKAVRFSSGTVLRGFADASLTSTNASGVVRATNIGSHVIMRELIIVASAGPCLALTGSISYQVNLFFCGLYGASAGTITGFDVQAIKGCFVSAAAGLTFAGTTNKVFVESTPFYSVTGSAITFDATLAAEVADITTSFFKFDSPGTCITAESGYSVGEGKLRGSLIDGTATPLSGLAPSDTEWTMTDNTGIRDSRIAAGFYLTASASTTIAAVDTPVKVAGTTAGLSLNERFSHANNRLTYTGSPPALVAVNVAVAVTTGNNQSLTFYVAKNGSVITESGTNVRVGSGNDERVASVNALVELETDDYIEVWAENTSGSADLTCATLNLTAKA